MSCLALMDGSRFKSSHFASQAMDLDPLSVWPCEVSLVLSA